jgi:hypothetical protein
MKILMTLILHQTQFGCIKDDSLNKLFEFFIIVDLVTTQKFMQFDINTHNYVSFKIFNLTLQYDFFTALILHQT